METAISAVRRETKRNISSQPKVLILLDMNGTLLYRSNTRINCNRQHDLKHNKLFYYFRPGARDFVKWLATEQRVHFGFYTSMRAANALPAIEEMLENGLAFLLFDRNFNKPDGTGSEKWSSMRDLPRVWSSEQLLGYRYSEYNTICIDDSLRKMREYPHNVIKLPEFTHERVLAEENSEILSSLQQYLSNLLDSSIPLGVDCDIPNNDSKSTETRIFDVRNFIQNNQFMS